MADTKQPLLNGAYYGPSIPPPKKYHSPGGGGDSLRGYLFTLIFKILVSIIVAVGLAILAFWMIFRPNRVKFHVTDAALTQFDLNTNTNTLYYNLSFNMTVRNPNKYIGIYYDRLKAKAYYEDHRFAAVLLPPFYQGHENTTALSLAFNSQKTVVLRNKKLSKFNSEKRSGSYSIDVKLYLRVRFKLRGVETPRFEPEIECDLKVPLSSNGKVSGSFETTTCGLDW